MIIAGAALGEISIAAQGPQKAPTKPPRPRQTIAKADAQQIPEPR
jgi:hypothetical protein